jgi:uncharacterized protein YdaU (DUF1376 family)
MSEGPWIRFFPSDWLAGTRGMTAAETGIYITLVAMMYERGEPIPNDTGRLARLCGTTTAALKSTLAVLCDEGKITIIDGGLWNDRVGVETEIRRDKSTSAQKSAEARWEKQKQNQQNKDASALHSDSARNSNQKSEAIKTDANASVRRERDIQFDEFWSMYPRKVAKPDSRKLFDKALTDTPFATILAGAQRYAVERIGEDAKYTMHPDKWLRGQHWLDEPIPTAAPRPHSTASPEPRNAGERAFMRLQAENGHDPTDTISKRLEPGIGRRQTEGNGDAWPLAGTQGAFGGN